MFHIILISILLLFSLVLVVTMGGYSTLSPSPSSSLLHENFVSGYQEEHFENVDEIYDDFYAGVYKTMISDYKKPLVDFEVEELLGVAKDTTHHLDIGCGIGDHVLVFCKRGVRVTGLDQSESMLRQAEFQLKELPKDQSSLCKLVQGDIRNKSLFPAKKFSSCSTFYFSFYFADTESLCQNAHFWLSDNGVFAVHLVDPEKFDPILDAANPFVGFSLKKYLKQNISKIVFKNMEYTSDFQYDTKTKIGSFLEEFVLPKEMRKRKQKQVLHMSSLQECVDTITKKGRFVYIAHTDLERRGYKDQYIFYFKKND